MMRSVPTISTMSAARSGVHFVVGYSVMPHQKPLSRARRTVCSSTWSMQTRGRIDAAVALEHVDDHARALVLVLQVRRVDEDQLVGLHGQVDVFLEDGGLVARVLVEADLADAEDVGPVEVLGDQGDDLAREA